MHRTCAAALTAGMTASLLLAASPASAGTLVAGYKLNETGGSTMRDSTGRYHGSIGADVAVTGTSYRFDQPPSAYRPQHLVTVPNAAALNPGTKTWAVTARVRFTQTSGNIVQKGQSTGSYFKLESHNGALSCLFRGSSGSRAAGTGSKDYNDGLWHIVTCRRSGSEVSITVDGVTRRATGATGTVSNRYPLALGGKTACNGTTVGCDYWMGEMDYLRVVVG